MSLEAQVATDPSGAALPPAAAVDPERFPVLVPYSQSEADVGLRPRAVDAIIFKAGGCVVQQPKPATPTIVILEILPNNGRLADWPTLGVNCEMSRHRRGVDEPTLCIEDYILEYGVEVNQYGQVVSNYTSSMGTPPVRLTTWPHFLKWLADKRTPFPTIGRFVRTDEPIVDKSASSSGSRATVDAADEQAAVERRLTDATGMYAAFGDAGAVQGNAVWRSAQQFKQVLMASNVVNTAGYSGLMLTFNLSKEVSAMVELADLDITYSLDFASIIVFAGQVDRLTGKWRCGAKDKPIQDALYRSSLTSGALVLPENWLLGCIIDGVLHDPRKSRLLLHVSNAGDPFCDTTLIELWQELPMEPIDDHYHYAVRSSEWDMANPEVDMSCEQDNTRPVEIEQEVEGGDDNTGTGSWKGSEEEARTDTATSALPSEAAPSPVVLFDLFTGAPWTGQPDHLLPDLDIAATFFPTPPVESAEPDFDWFI